MMKRIKNILLCLIFISTFNILKVSANPYNQNGPYGINCTWYAWNMANEKAHVVLPSLGNAKDWYNNASSLGYTVGTTPRANSIVVWGGWTSYGHVGYVESVGDNVINVWDSSEDCIDEDSLEFKQCIENGVSEETDKACRANAKRIACKYTLSPDRYGITGYIYLDYAPVKTNNVKENTNTQEQQIKSSNNNLTNISISNVEFEYSKDVTDYQIDVENNIESITIGAEKEDEKASIEGIGDYNLNVGINEIKLKVTAEDGNIKEYNITITRKEKVETILTTSNNIVNKSNTYKNTLSINYLFIILELIFTLILVISILTIIILKKRKKK